RRKSPSTSRSRGISAFREGHEERASRSGQAITPSHSTEPLSAPCGAPEEARDAAGKVVEERASEELERVELVDLDDPHARQAAGEGGDVVLEVVELDPGDVLQVRGHEFAEAHEAGAALRRRCEVLQLRDEVLVMADQHDVVLALEERLGGALDRDVDDLALAAQRDRLVAQRDERLHEAHREAVGDGEEEQALDRLLPRVLRVLEELVPAGALVRLRSSAEHRDAEGGVDVLAVHQEVCGPFGHGSTLRAPGPRPTAARAVDRGQKTDIGVKPMGLTPM